MKRFEISVETYCRHYANVRNRAEKEFGKKKWVFKYPYQLIFCGWAKFLSFEWDQKSRVWLWYSAEGNINEHGTHLTIKELLKLNIGESIEYNNLKLQLVIKDVSIFIRNLTKNFLI